MKTEPMAHQVEGIRRLAENPKYFALAADQGTGKTWMLLADIEHQFNAGLIDAALVIAPKGVHINWIRREIPAHLSVPYRADHWVSGAGLRRQRQRDKLLKPGQEGELTVFAINIDALNTKDGRAWCERFLHQHRTMSIVDESSRIKSGTARRTKVAIELGKMSTSRRIASGTMIAQSPLDAFYQFEFLAPRRGLLGTTSYRAFVAEFADVLPPHHPLVQHALERSRGRGNPQLIRRDEETGQPVYRNLEKLQNFMAPYTFRVLKEDCLDLPPKVYQTRYYELAPAQRRVYESVEKEMRYMKEDGELDTYSALTKSTKLQQITSNFIMTEQGVEVIAKNNPRLDLLQDILEDISGQCIIWAVYREEIAQIAILLESMGITFVEYHGGTPEAEREIAIDSFQSGGPRVFLANAQAAGIGLTLTNATTAIYYSCGYSLELRLQSEDRCHRIGTKGTVVYIDLAAVDTVDERIAAALQAKQNVANAIMNGL